MRPEPWIAPGNDYRGVAGRIAVPPPSIAVIIPVYNRPQLLANVLAGLSRQSITGFRVIVVDDGSDEPVAPVVDGAAKVLDIALLRQERDGFGTHRARNLAVGRADTDVVAFLDADCIPSTDWLDRHMFWHRRASNLVVTGSRRHLDKAVDPSAIVAGTVDLQAIASSPAEATDPFAPDDWRRLVYRRSQRLLLGDGAFRAVIGGNSSLWRDRYDEVGGQSTAFTAWGGEDTEFAWRIWNAGAFVVPEDRAMIYHQRFLDPPGAVDRRKASARRARELMADRIPQSFYRKEPSHLYTVPTVSWIVTVDDELEADRAWREASRATFDDTELILVGDGSSVVNRVTAADAGERFSIAGTLAAAVEAARGEIVAIADGRARFDRRLLARSMRRFDDARVTAVRVGYRAGGQRFLRLADLSRIDAVIGRDGLPFFALMRRRELMKDRPALEQPAEAWTRALERSTTSLLVTDLVEVPEEATRMVKRSLPRPSDLLAAGAGEIARGAMRAARKPVGTAPTGPTPGGDRVGIEYVGLAGHDNLGDDAMLEAIRRLMPWAEIGVDVADPRAVMLGGGTLLNAGGYYLTKVRRVDGPNMERLVFGTGVRGVEYWGRSESLDDWRPFLESAISIGVRGPSSLEALREWGYGGPAEVIGDPALSLDRPDGAVDVDGRVVVCPVYTAGECWGGDDGVVFDEFARVISGLKAEGRDVVMMTAHPSDDRWAVEIMRNAGFPDLAYLAGYADLDTTLRLLASADLVIGERLHAVILAAAMGTPFVAVEYRPKVGDFAKSIAADPALVVRTDAMRALGPATDIALRSGGSFAASIQLLRKRQREQTETLRRLLMA